MSIGLSLGTQLGRTGGKSNPALFLAVGNSLAFRDQGAGGTLTSSGALRYQPGSGGRINYFANPSFETDTNGWQNDGAGASISRIADTTGQGSFALECTSTTLNHGLTTTPTGGSPKVLNPGTYTLSFDIWLVSGHGNWRVSVSSVDASGGIKGSIVSNQAVTVTAQKQRLTYTLAASQTGVHRIEVWVSNNAASSSTIRVDGFLLEQGSTASSYFDGSSPGCAWADPITGIAGTANASPSISRAAFWVEEATTNTVPDPSFEAASITTNWAIAGAAAISKVATHAYVGSNAAKVSCTATSADGMTQLLTSGAAAASGQTWTTSAYVRAFASGDVGKTVRLRISGRGAAGSFAEEAYSSGFTLTDGWQRISFTTTLGNASTTSVICSVYNNAAVAVDFVVDAIQLEQKAYATSYCDGSLGTGYSWSGTAHASASSRTGVTVSAVATTARFSSVRGSVALFVYAPGDIGIFRSIWTVGSYGTDDFVGMALDDSANTFRTRSRVAANPERFATTASAPDSWVFLAGDWDATTLGISKNLGTRSTTSRVETPSGIFSSSMALNAGIDGIVGPLAVFNRPLTTTELTNLNNLEPYQWWNAV